MSYVDTLTVAEVEDPETFAAYIEQVTGRYAPQLDVLSNQLTTFFKRNPHMDYRSLCENVHEWLDAA